MDGAPKSFYISLFAAVLLASSALALGTGFSEQLYTPGKVVEKHSDAGCLGCHKPFRGAVAKGCMSGGCHTKAELEGKGEKRLKPAVIALHTGEGGDRCLECHTEHKGKTGAITLAYHDETGQQGCLRCHRGEGGEIHAKLTDSECSSCHSFRDWKESAFTHERVSDEPCAKCHGAPRKDFHASLPKAWTTDDSDCSACHDTKEWKPASFEHRLILIGRGPQGNPETSPPCDECHGSEAAKAHAQINLNSCQACHASTDDWKAIRFDHDSVANEACTACHAIPKGELHASISNDCQGCHNTNKWKPARFEHSKIKAGQSQACSRCHSREGSRAHPGIKSQACATCHSTAAWRPSIFRHPWIPEFGEHMEHLSCADCHPSSLSQAEPCSACHGGGGRKSGRWEWDD